MNSSSVPSMNEVFLQKLKEIILQNLSNEHFGINDLVKEMNLSRSQVHRKIKKISGKSITQFIREIRLEDALKLLKSEVGTAAEIGYRVGFNSPSYFNKCFREYFGITPGEVNSKTIVKRKNEKERKNPFTDRKLKFLSIISFILVVTWAAYYIMSKRSDAIPISSSIKSIAIMPLVNNTGDSSLDYLEYGISEMLINNLARSEDLKIIDNQTIFEVAGNIKETQLGQVRDEISKEVASRVNTSSYIAGNYLLSGTIFRINLKLVNMESNEVTKTFLAEGETDSLFSMAGTLSFEIKNHLELKLLEEINEIEPISYAGTTSPEAYRNYIKALKGYWGGSPGNGSYYFRLASEIDPEFSSPYFYKSIISSYYGNHSLAKEDMMKANEGKDKMPEMMQLWMGAFMSQYFEKKPYKSIKYFKQVTEINPLSRLNWYWIGMFYNVVEEYDNALLAFKQIEKINRKLGLWKSHKFYLQYSYSYLKLKEYNKAQKILKEASRHFPESSDIPYYQAVCALLQNDSVSADIYIKQRRTALEKEGWTGEPFLMAQEGHIYRAAGQIEKAVEIYRQATKLRLVQGPAIDANNQGNNLGWYYLMLGDLLISNDINFEKGMDYIIKAKELLIKQVGHEPSYILNVYGYALFKQGKPEQALEFLKKAEELITIQGGFIYGDLPKNAHLIAEVEEAIASKQ